MVTCFDLAQFTVPSEDDRFQYLIYQVENCPTTGRDHIQAYLELKVQTRFNQVKQMFAPAVVHLEGRKAKTAEPAIAYCSKEETRVDGPWEFGERPDTEKKTAPKIDWVSVRTKVQSHASWAAVLASDDEEVVRATAAKMNYVKELFMNKPVVATMPPITLRKWQKKVEELLTGPVVKRRIIWIWSEKSGTGKTTFFDYCSAKYDVLPGADWANTLFVYDGQSILWYDRTRAQSTDNRGVDQFYSDLERFSNDTIHTSTKYAGVRKRVSCHVVVTANSEPDEFRLPQRFLTVQAKTDEEEKADDEKNAAEYDEIVAAQELEDIRNGVYDAILDASDDISTPEIILTKPSRPGQFFVHKLSEHPPANFPDSPPGSPELSWAKKARSSDDDMDVENLSEDFGDDPHLPVNSQ